VPSSGRRACASSSLPFAAFQAVSKAAGVTINGVLHAAIAGALRAELLDRGEPIDRPTVAAFGISADPPGSTRRWGNTVTPPNVNVTTYSYAGRMTTGLICTPEALPEPQRFLDRMAESLAELQAAVDAERVGHPRR